MGKTRLCVDAPFLVGDGNGPRHRTGRVSVCGMVDSRRVVFFGEKLVMPTTFGGMTSKTA